MIKQLVPKMLMATAALALVSADVLAHAKPPAMVVARAKVAETAAGGEAVAYDALEHHVGDVLVIETTLNTVRRGKLVRYTNPTLTIELGPEQGSIELSVPRETIRNVRVLPAAAAQPEVGAKPGQGSRSAQES
jgi:lactate dehydrogenase-like 2-hydroxyacid dehydrogenase